MCGAGALGLSATSGACTRFVSFASTRVVVGLWDGDGRTGGFHSGSGALKCLDEGIEIGCSCLVGAFLWGSDGLLSSHELETASANAALRDNVRVSGRTTSGSRLIHRLTCRRIDCAHIR